MAEDLEILGKALSCASRIRLLKLLGEEGMSVSAAVSETGLSQATVSYHLGVLVGAGLVERARHGSGHLYRWPPGRRLYVGWRSA